MLELYHNNMSVCAQKVRLVVREKGLEPVEHHMMLRNGDVHEPDYLKLNPKGVVPTLIVDGQPIIESTIICEYLEDAYPEPPLLPDDPIGRSQVRQWTLQPDAGLHQACGVLSVTVAWREQMLAAGGAQLKNRPDAAGANDQFAAILEQGIDFPGVPAAVKVYERAIARIAGALSAGGPWLCGDSYTLAETAMLPYVCRLEDLAMDWFWEGERSVVADWLARAKARPNFSGISDYIVPDYVSLCAAKGTEATPKIRAMLGN
ncbi:MAG: glutathione S-transferase family protein [Halieaceae bacterium]|nr:glutathione S-transferase family protein [Halieaceae bacterium]